MQFPFTVWKQSKIVLATSWQSNLQKTPVVYNIHVPWTALILVILVYKRAVEHYSLCPCRVWRKGVGCLRVHHRYLKQLIKTLGMERPSRIQDDTHKQMQHCLQTGLGGYLPSHTQWQTDSPEILPMWVSTLTASHPWVILQQKSATDSVMVLVPPYVSQLHLVDMTIL